MIPLLLALLACTTDLRALRLDAIRAGDTQAEAEITVRIIERQAVAHVKRIVAAHRISS